jgi:hypothetical protein
MACSLHEILEPLSSGKKGHRKMSGKQNNGENPCSATKNGGLVDKILD